MAIGSPANDDATTCPRLTSCDQATGYQWSGCAPTRRRSTDASPVLISECFTSWFTCSIPCRSPEMDREDLLRGFVDIDCLGVAADEFQNRLFAFASHSADQRNVDVIRLARA